MTGARGRPAWRRAIVTAGAVLGLAGAAPAIAYDTDVVASEFLIDRVEIGGGWHRQYCDETIGTERATVTGQGIRLVKLLSPTVYVGLDLGRVNRTGSQHPNLEDGMTGAVQVGLEDQDLAWSGGVTYDPDNGFPRVNGSARIGGRDNLFLSASYARSLPVFSSDDVDVGMGTGSDGNMIWLGASMPINRDVVGVKAIATVRPASRLELTGSGRFGNSEAGRIEGFSVSVAYVNPPGSEPEAPTGRLGRWLERDPGRFQFIGAGGIVGAIGGVLTAGAAVQRPCGHAAFGPAVAGALVGGALGAIFGNAMW